MEEIFVIDKRDDCHKEWAANVPRHEGMLKRKMCRLRVVAHSWSEKV